MSAPGTTIDVAFAAFQVEGGWDGLFIYDGASTAAPQIGSGNALAAGVGHCGARGGGGLPGNAGPAQVPTGVTIAFCPPDLRLSRLDGPGPHHEARSC